MYIIWFYASNSMESVYTTNLKIKNEEKYTKNVQEHRV